MDKLLKIGTSTIAVLTDGETFRGLGRITIDGVAVRSGRLPLRPYTQSWSGHELAELRLLGVDEGREEARLRLAATFRPLPVKLMKDHSFDPIHETGDWDAPRESAHARLDLVLRPARDTFNGRAFAGFSYHYEYDGPAMPLFYLLDQASWELGGDICGATVISQSSCSAPVITFAADTAWTTEGTIYWDPNMPNPVMTHNLPRWASHGAFDFQCRGNDTLLGVFGRVELVRSLLRREPGKAELKTFDKHIFDQSPKFSTTSKSILLNRDAKTATDQHNLWTWVMDEVHGRARAEFGLREELPTPYLSVNYWHSFTFDSYYKDLLPAAISIGVRRLFIDNVKKSAMTERCPNPGKFTWNMCCGHEYEVAPLLGGPGKLKDFVTRCAAHGIAPFSWTNNDQALSSPVNEQERDGRNWFVKMEDTRLKYGGAYTNVFSILDFKNPEVRRHFVDAHKKIRAETGLGGYLFDSFYNLGFMPVNYTGGKPATMWRELLQVFKELQDADVHFHIESFGPFGMVQHGCPATYNLEQCWVCYRVNLGSGYTTIPTGGPLAETCPSEASRLHYTLAHMALPGLPLFVNKQRIDEVWTAEHRRALADYYAALPAMARRYLQEDGRAVLWHDAAGKTATLWNFVARRVALPGRVRDLSTGAALPRAKTYRLAAGHTYQITGAKLPTRVGG